MAVVAAIYPGTLYPTAPTAWDRAGHHLVGRKGGIAGGIRLNLACSGGAERLPSECVAPRIDAVAPDLARPGALRAQVGGMFVDAALPETRESRALYLQAVALALRLSVAQLVMLAPAANLRQYRETGRGTGFALRMRPDVDVTFASRHYGMAMGFAHTELTAPRIKYYGDCNLQSPEYWLAMRLASSVMH
jgi:hypothetical protein